MARCSCVSYQLGIYTENPKAPCSVMGPPVVPSGVCIQSSISVFSCPSQDHSYSLVTTAGATAHKTGAPQTVSQVIG
jgi:hypothetical protein